ncbi:MAG TPA: CoA ester lyase [Afifellaceae bacterium]|nr:CoA ester lyase [Afifellaceae bacterium]
MRSLLFVPGDSPRKLAKALGAGADVLLLDLEDSVAADAKVAARRSVRDFLREAKAERDGPALYVRINALSSGLSEGDLDEVMVAGPDGVMLPKCEGRDDVALLDSRLAVREALHGLGDGATRILPIATETPAALFGMSGYRGSSPRLAGLAWWAEDLAAAIGAGANMDADGSWLPPFSLARNLCLFAAAAARVAAIDTVFTDYRDLGGLKREADAAARDGFTGKLAIHPDQVPIINEAFTPSDAAVMHARRILAAFAEAGDAGVVGLEGAMLDRPHLEAARRLLARAGEGKDTTERTDR